MRMLRRLIGILVLGMFVLAMVQVVGATPDQQTWYFTDEDASAPTWSGAIYNKIMTKGVEGGDTVITLEKGERVWFYADELAACDVTFPDGTWNTAYWMKALNSTDSGKRITTRLQGINSEGAKLSGSYGYAQKYYDTSNPSHFEEVTESLKPSESFTIPEGGRFAIEVLWAGGAAGNLEIHCNPSGKHASKATSPSSDPGYPVPELSTLILFSVGLLVLAGYVGLRRRNNKQR